MINCVAIMNLKVFALLFALVNYGCVCVKSNNLREKYTELDAENKQSFEVPGSRHEALKPESHSLASNTKDGTRAASPNVVLLLVDDLGYGDLAWSGHPTSLTPAIDALAAQGKQFTQFYVTSPVCSPSRASLLTGRYQSRSGIYPGVLMPQNIYGLPHNETTIAEMLKPSGYNTMIVGKWHLGVGATGEYLPTTQGFDDYFGMPYSNDMCPCNICFPDDGPCHNDTCFADLVSCPLYDGSQIIEQPVDMTTLTQRLVDRAIDFVSDSVMDGKPFFLYLPFVHVHYPNFSSMDWFGKSSRGLFGDSLLELDAGVQRLMAQLQQLGVVNDTIVLFLSDNGPSLREHGRGGCAGPLRCGKGTTWEGGVRVPAFVTWPGTIVPERTDALLSSLDVLPTLATLTNSSLPLAILDGVDASTLLLNSGQPSPREFFAVYPKNASPEQGPFAVVWGHFKAHYYSKGSALSDDDNNDAMCIESHPLTLHDPPLLYDLSVDPGERWNIANDSQQADLLAQLGAWRDAHMADMTWTPPLISLRDERVQPCCTDSGCEPFPQCCDCVEVTAQVDSSDCTAVGSTQCSRNSIDSTVP